MFAKVLNSERAVTVKALTVTVMSIAVFASAGCRNGRSEAGAEKPPQVRASTNSEAPQALASVPTAGAKGRKQRADSRINGVPQSVPAPSDVATPPPGAEQTRSGLFTVLLKPGQGSEKPTVADRVKIRYSAWTKAGVLFESTEFKDEPVLLEVAAKSSIPGLKEALQMLSQGEARRFWIPASLAYGDTPLDAANPAGPLTFDIELVELERAPVAPPAPPDVASAPADALRTPSGLAYRVLQTGSGTVHPAAADLVGVKFTGWKATGEVFDSSVPLRAAKEYYLERLVPGWAEGLELMVEGERRLLWIPARLAHGAAKPGQPSKKPQGDLVVDVELVSVTQRGPSSVR
jgi:peptidylprolyl isomerase